MPASVHSYRDRLGFELIATSRPGPRFDWALLRLNGVELMLNTAYEAEYRPPAPEPARVAAHGDTGLFFGCPDVDLAYRQLGAWGIDDPDGFVLRLQWPVDGKWPHADGCRRPRPHDRVTCRTVR